MPIVNHVTDLWWLIYNVHETLLLWATCICFMFRVDNAQGKSTKKGVAWISPHISNETNVPSHSNRLYDHGPKWLYTAHL